MAIGWDELGDLLAFGSKEEMRDKMKSLYGVENSYRNQALTTWQFANEMKPGDVVFVKRGRKQIIGRGVELRLLYADERFAIPSDVHLIGAMNTADRSLALIDFALRRRFAFFELEPAFDSEGFRAFQRRVGNPKFDRLIEAVKALNDEIRADFERFVRFVGWSSTDSSKRRRTARRG